MSKIRKKLIFVFCIFIYINICNFGWNKVLDGKVLPTINIVDYYPEYIVDTLLSQGVTNGTVYGVYVYRTKDIYVLKCEKRYRVIAHELCHWWLDSWDFPASAHAYLDKHCSNGIFTGGIIEQDAITKHLATSIEIMEIMETEFEEMKSEEEAALLWKKFFIIKKIRDLQYQYLKKQHGSF